MKKGTRITLICIIAILMLLVIGGTIYGYVQKYAYADYTDLNSNSVINFNQYVLDIYTHNATLNNGYTNIVNYSLTQEHYYYLKLELNTNNSIRYEMRFRNIDNSGSQSVFTGNRTTGIETIIQLNTNYNYELLSIYAYSSNLYIKNAWLIDLTQAFGSNNIPTLEQAQEYFNSDYYNYNTGTPMPYSKDYLQGYMDGMSDLSESVSVTLNNDIIGNTAFPYVYNGVNSSFAYNGDDNVWLLYGYACIPIGATLESGIIATFDTYVWANYTGTKYLFYFYAREDGSLIQLGYAPIVDNTTDMLASLTMVLPTDIDTIYIAMSDTASFSLSESSLYVYKTSLSFKTPNLSAIINNAYNRGYYSATNEYAEQSTKWLDIYYQGVRYGQQHNGFNDAWDFVGSAFSGIGQIFSIELLPNVPLSTFILVPLMVSLIFFVVKLVKGGGN